MSKYVYFFGGGKTEGKKELKELLGGKGANLAEMANLGVPVPPGFTISTEACKEFYENGEKHSDDAIKQVQENLEKLEEALGKKFGDKSDPLLVSVRSGAAVSMPGMMDTVLNLGLNDEAVEGLTAKTNNARFAWDAYRRFLQMYGNVVMQIDSEHFEEALEEVKKEKGVELDTELDVDDLKKVVEKYKEVVKKVKGKEFPLDPKEQLWGSINAVFGSWNNPRAIKYRQINDIRGLIGTAVNVQSMVFGNMGDTSATGVCFSRNPSNGDPRFYGEYLINAQGEDVVAGIRTPQEITKEGSIEWAQNNDISEEERASKYPSLEESMPELYKQIIDIKDKLEKHYKDMQDMEFTIEDHKLYFLQTRTGKRTAAAAVKIAVDMVKEGLIDEKTAVLRVAPNSLDQLLHPMIDPKEKLDVIAKGLPASPGAAVGQIYFTAEDAEKASLEGKKVLLVRTETSPEDIGGMSVAQGILTARGGMTSHAAVVARGMGTCCVAGCGDLTVSKDSCTIKGQKYSEGEWLTLDGTKGEIIKGKVQLIEPELSGDFGILMEWANKYKKLGVRTNADTPKDSETALKFGAEGIGLTRTEHMFFEGERIDAVREMILAEDVEGRKKALAKILPMQKGDFLGIYKVMKGKPVTVRLLDPPLHEFVPHNEKEQRELAGKIGVPFEKIKEKVESLDEFNPMLGHRGCRLGITYPEITEMQATAIFEAACEIKKEGQDIIPEVMVPLVGKKEELKLQKEIIVKVAEDTIKKYGVDLKYMVGTMIEVPRAAVTADQIAEEAEFFSFGTNDLTQLGCGFSRDDAGAFLKEYVDKGVYERDPFQALDQEGVGELVKIAVEKGTKTRPGMKLGICGEHGGEPESVKFCHRVGLSYVSCSPFRVPIAILAAAQAAIEDEK